MLRTAAQRISTPARPAGFDGGDHLFERARHLAAGLLGHGVVHEFANLLTVLDGMGQMSRLGITWADAQQMISGREGRGRDLIAAYRHFFAERASDTPVGFDAEMRQLEALLKVRLHGQHTKLDFSGASAPFVIDGRKAPVLRTTLLLTAFAHVEGTRPGAEELRSIRCVPGGSGDMAEWVLRSEAGEHALPTAGSAPELFGLAGALANQWGGSLRTIATGPGGRESRVSLRAALVD